MTDPARPTASLDLGDLRDIDPYPGYERMRAAGPVVWDRGMSAWLVLSHEGCAFVERNETLFAEPTGSLPGASEIVGRRDIRSLVGDPHAALHRSLAHAWQPDPIALLALAAVRPIVAARFAALAAGSRFEIFHDVARLLPIAVVSRILGLPDGDLQTLDRAKGWMDAVLAWRHSFGVDPDIRESAVRATRSLEPALLETVRDRRERPRHDAISFLWAAGREVAADWGERDVLDNAKFVFEAGSETTASLITNAVHRLLEHPAAERERIVGDPLAFAPFLEEVLRHSTVIHLRARTATADARLGGVVIEAGARVIAVNAAANRDPDRWEQPDRFDPGRSRLWGHLAFNVGPRHCVGAHLARMQATEVICGMWRALPAIEPTDGAPPAVPIGFVSRTWRPVEVTHAPTTPQRARAGVLAGSDSVAETPPGQPLGPLRAAEREGRRNHGQPAPRRAQ